MDGSSYRSIALLFALGVTLHNAEEALFLVPWARSHVKLPFDPNPKIYWLVTSLVSVAIWIAAIGVNAHPENLSFQLALAGFALAMAVNALLPHLIVSLATRSYSPGTATGMLLNLPLGALILWKSASSGTISASELWSHAAIYAVALGSGTFGSLFAAHALLARPETHAPKS